MVSKVAHANSKTGHHEYRYGGGARRSAQRLLADELSEHDQKYDLCRYTGLGYHDILNRIAIANGNVVRSVQLLQIRYNAFYLDDGWWALIAGWMRMFIPQYEQGFYTVAKQLVTIPSSTDQERILAVAAKALNVAPEVLQHFAEHREEIEQFLALQRATLGTIAESKLWELVLAGDPATIRWVLPKIKTDVFGEKVTDPAEGGKMSRNIKIIDVTGDI